MLDAVELRLTPTCNCKHRCSRGVAVLLWGAVKHATECDVHQYTVNEWHLRAVIYVKGYPVRGLPAANAKVSVPIIVLSTPANCLSRTGTASSANLLDVVFEAFSCCVTFQRYCCMTQLSLH